MKQTVQFVFQFPGPGHFYSIRFSLNAMVHVYSLLICNIIKDVVWSGSHAELIGVKAESKVTFLCCDLSLESCRRDNYNEWHKIGQFYI